jgi:hypothetical protein
MNDPQTVYRGWSRPWGNGTRWRCIVEAADLEEYWSKLLALTAALPPGETIVLAGFRHPDDSDARRKRR